MGGNYAIDQATGGPEKRIKAKQSELQLIIREEVRNALAEMLPTSTGGVMRIDKPGDYREEVPFKNNTRNQVINLIKIVILFQLGIVGATIIGCFLLLLIM